MPDWYNHVSTVLTLLKEWSPVITILAFFVSYRTFRNNFILKPKKEKIAAAEKVWQSMLSNIHNAVIGLNINVDHPEYGKFKVAYPFVPFRKVINSAYKILNSYRNERYAIDEKLFKLRAMQFRYMFNILALLKDLTNPKLFGFVKSFIALEGTYTYLCGSLSIDVYPLNIYKEHCVFPILKQGETYETHKEFVEKLRPFIINVVDSWLKFNIKHMSNKEIDIAYGKLMADLPRNRMAT